MVSSNEAKPLDETKHYFVSSDARLCCRPGPVGCCLFSSWWLHWSWGHVQEYAGRVNFAPISKYHLLYSIVIWSWGHVHCARICRYMCTSISVNWWNWNCLADAPRDNAPRQDGGKHGQEVRLRTGGHNFAFGQVRTISLWGSLPPETCSARFFNTWQ